MPPQPAWFHRLPTAIEELERLPCPTVDRLALQNLLHLSKAQAWRVLTQLGVNRSPGTSHRLAEPCAFEQRRHARVAAHLA